MSDPASPRFSKAPIWLFKAHPSNAEESYTIDLQAAGYEPRYIPALVEEFQTAELEELLADDGEDWDGVIITSKRGAEGWVRAVRSLLSRGRKDLKFSPIPLYTVGTTSIDALADAEISHHLLPDILGATSAKNALALGEEMLRDLGPSSSGQSERRFLFVRGDKSANDLQPRLRDAGYTVQEVQVYSTSANPELAKVLEEETRALSAGGGGVEGEATTVWLTFFSPSSAGFALPHLDPLLHRSGRPGPTRVRIAAIGEKTQAFLVQSGLTVDAVADVPNAAGLVQALQAAG